MPLLPIGDGQVELECAQTGFHALVASFLVYHNIFVSGAITPVTIVLVIGQGAPFHLVQTQTFLSRIRLEDIASKMAQPDGSYPRLNGELLKTGLHQEKIASLIGSLEASGTCLRLSDQGQVGLDISQWVAEEPITAYCDSKVEVIGQVSSPDRFLVSTIAFCRYRQ